MNNIIQNIGTWLWGWPLVLFMVFNAVLTTFALDFVQIRYFIDSWKNVLWPEEQKKVDVELYITPFQAFINTLSASIGNGSTAGMATAMYSGGPGAAFWIFIIGFFNMAIRFAEVYASTVFIDRSAAGVFRGGPMVFLKRVPGSSFLSILYAFFCLLTSFVAGSGMQCNSMCLGIQRITGLDKYFIATLLFFMILYIMLGGAERIISFSKKVIPIKVGLFFLSTIIVLGYHYATIGQAINIIMASAFTFKAINGALIGHTMQNALRFGLSRSLSATEAGLGTAGVLFGATATQHPVKSGIMAMASIFISNHLVCVPLLLIYVSSGVWNSGLTSTALTSAAYETVFGSAGAWIVTFLSITFGLGVLVSYAYIGRECWNFFTGGKFLWVYNSIYCLMAFVGALTKVDIIWSAVDIANAGMLIINLYGLLFILPQARRAIKEYEKTNID